jgi:hypothetical protein
MKAFPLSPATSRIVSVSPAKASAYAAGDIKPSGTVSVMGMALPLFEDSRHMIYTDHSLSIHADRFLFK